MSDAKKAIPTVQKARSLTFQGIPGFGRAPTLQEEKREEPRETEEKNGSRRIEISEGKYYSVGEELGSGAMAVVYKAKYVTTRKDGKEAAKVVALKEMVIAEGVIGGSDPAHVEAKKKEIYDSFFSEVEKVFKLKHENIIDIIDYGELEDGRPYCAMEYLEGMDLLSFMFKGKMDWNTIQSIALQVCDALSYAHEYKEDGEDRPIIHRDIKPHNIFLTNDSKGEMKRVKVLDFGLAEIVLPNKSKGGSEADFAGTPDYASPEQLRVEPLDHRTDIYSFGVVLYEMLTGQLPFEFKHSGHDITKKFKEFKETVSTDLPPPFPDTVPNAVKAIVKKCLAKLPEHRYQSMRALRDDIDSTSKSVSYSEVIVPAAPTPEEKLPSTLLSHTFIGEVRKAPTFPGAPQDQAKAHMESPWAQQAGEQIDRDMLPSSHLPLEPSEPEPVSQKQIATAIVRNPLLADEPTQLTFRAPVQPKKMTRLKWAALGVAGLSVLTAGTVLVATGVGRSRDQVMVQPADPIRNVSQDAMPRTPQTHSSTRPAVPDPQPVQRNFTITVRAEPRGVEVVMDRSVVCNGTGNCEITIPQGSVPVELTFRKTGYREETESVVPDQDRTVEVRLERTRRPGGRPGGQQGNPNGRPPLTSPD